MQLYDITRHTSCNLSTIATGHTSTVILGGQMLYLLEHIFSTHNSTLPRKKTEGPKGPSTNNQETKLPM